MLYYLTVWVAHSSYHGNEPLTYSFTEKLAPGTIVTVPLRKQYATGVVAAITTKPRFPAKPITEVKATTPLPPHCIQLLEWLLSYYPAPSGVITSLFVSSNFLKGLNEAPPSATDRGSSQELPPLTSEQKRALKIIRDSSTPVLLHGDTGSGKTRLYIDRSLDTLNNGKSVLMLTPEIGLTPQLFSTFKTNLPYPIYVLHSALTAKERRNLWLSILYSREPSVVIGPRSALFAPLPNIGLVVVDEAHDNSYKQDQSPRYQALRVAGKLASLCNAQLILGSATPPIDEYYIYEARKFTIIRMQELAVQSSAPPPTLTVIDAKQRENFAKHPTLSDTLLSEVAECLERGEQALVFLNRRGTARAVLCQTCGWQAVCPRCNIGLTYHGDSHDLRCHTCGYHATTPTSCPECSGIDIMYRSMGTKSLLATLQQYFPSARIARFDTDNTKEEKLEHHYAAIKSGEVDILVGTQMLVKGLDLPLLSCVAVVNADSSLQFPDYTAEEQAYQLLTQVIGRVGRGHRPGNVVIQTHNPDSVPLQAALHKNWEQFYQQQISERKQFLYPPFCYLLKLDGARKTLASAISAASKLKTILLESGLKLEVVGPSPRFIEQSGGSFNWQLVVKAKSRDQLVRALSLLPAKWTYDLDPAHLL